MSRLVFSLSALALLAGCGIPGGLERPDPMWGSDEALDYECTRELGRGERRDPRCAERQAPQPQQ
ncbi:MAG TPA: hypothetical protein PLK37_07120 [Terricaulis sp.]|nr:hypothetical protein [Terricaulis sp.]